MKWSSGSSRSGVLSTREEAAKHGCYSHATAKSQLGDRWIAYMYPRRTTLAIERPRYHERHRRTSSLPCFLMPLAVTNSLFSLSTGRSLLDRSSVAHSLTPTNICEAGRLSFASPGFVPPRRSLLLGTSASVLSSSRRQRVSQTGFRSSLAHFSSVRTPHPTPSTSCIMLHC